MKGLILCLLFTSTFSFLYAENQNDKRRLDEWTETIHLIWKEWMGKPELKYQPIGKDSLENFFGEWLGEYAAVNAKEGEKLFIFLKLHADGTWTSEEFRPDMLVGHWYLSAGMILLCEKEEDQEEDLATALILNKEGLRLLNARSRSGYVNLIKRTH